MLGPGGVLVGEESFKLEDLTKAALEVVGKLKNIATNLDRMLGDPAIKTTVQNIRDTTSSIKTMTSSTVQTIVRNVQETTDNVKTMTSSKEEVAQGLKNLPEILKKVEEATANLKAITEKSGQARRRQQEEHRRYARKHQADGQEPEGAYGRGEKVALEADP